MVSRSKSLEKRMAVMRKPRSYYDVVHGLEGYLFGYLVKEKGATPDIALSELAHDLARCNASPLAVWREFENQGLPKGGLVPEEFDFDHQMHLKKIRDSADTLYKLLSERRTPLELSSAIGATEAMFLTPSGTVGSRTLERSLLCRLGDLISLIPDVKPTELAQKVKGGNMVRQEAIRALLAIWARAGDGEPKFQRKGSAGGAMGPFAEFCDGVFKAVGIKTNGLEALIREAEEIWREGSAS